MSADFWAGYLSGAIGIVVGNPLDLLKTQLQAGVCSSQSTATHVSPTYSTPTTTAAATNAVRTRLHYWTELSRGAAAPILSYGALNALLYMTYNRSLALLTTGSPSLEDSVSQRTAASAAEIWLAGALGGLATFVVSAPAELIKCRAQVAQPPTSSLEIARDLWKRKGIAGLYLGAGITSVRDGVGYGFYFWSYELSKRSFRDPNDPSDASALRVLLCGGLAGVITWASIFPLDVIKTRVQTFDVANVQPRSAQHLESQPLLNPQPSRPSSWMIAKQAYQTDGIGVFFRGLGICSARAFVVNAVQWAVSHA